MGQPQILVWGHCTAAGRDPKLLFLATTPIALLLEGVKAAGSALLIPITVLRGSSTSSPACLRAGRWPQPTPRSQPLSGPALILAGRRKIRRLLRLEPGRWVCGQVLAEPLARGSSGHCSSARDPRGAAAGRRTKDGDRPITGPSEGLAAAKKNPWEAHAESPRVPKSPRNQNPQGTNHGQVPAAAPAATASSSAPFSGHFGTVVCRGSPKPQPNPIRHGSGGVTPPAFELLSARGSPASPRSAPPPRGAQKELPPAAELCSGGSQRAASPGVSFLLLLLLLHLQPQLSPWSHLTAAKGTGTALSLS